MTCTDHNKHKHNRNHNLDNEHAHRPFSLGGLYVSLANWQGFGQDFMGLAVERGAGCLYVHQMWKRVPKVEEAGANDASMDTSDDTVRSY